MHFSINKNLFYPVHVINNLSSVLCIFAFFLQFLVFRECIKTRSIFVYSPNHGLLCILQLTRIYFLVNLALVTINTSVILCIFHLFLLAVRVSFGCTWMHKNSLSSVPSLHARSPCRSLKYGSPVGSNSIDRSQRRFLSVYRKWRGVPGPLRPARARVDRNYAVISPRSTAL